MPEFFFDLVFLTSLCSIIIHQCGYDDRLSPFLYNITELGESSETKQCRKYLDTLNCSLNSSARVSPVSGACWGREETHGALLP